MLKRREGVDLIVVGSGAGALAAAVLAHERGLQVALYEKAPLVGGGTAYSGGVVWAPCNHVMRRKQIEDSVDAALLYLRHASGARGDETIARRYVESVGRVIEQVEAWTGIKWIIWPGQPDYYPDLPGACANGRALLQHPAAASDVLEPAEKELPGLALVRTTPHMDLVPGFQTADRPAREAWVAGRAIVGGLWKAILEREIEFHVSSPVRDVLVEDGRVTGVVVEADGATRSVRARRGVLLNTGGFDWNEAFARRYLPGPPTPPQTPTSNTGDGHRIAMGLGAATALMDKAVWHPSIRIPNDVHDDGAPLYRMFNAELSKPHSVVVNREGRRFASEAAYFAVSEAWMEVDPHLRTYPNVPSYFIADSRYRAKYGLPGVREGDDVPEWISLARTLAELAELLDVDAAGLADEIALYNRDAEQGTDTRFNRGTTSYERYWGDPDHGPNPTMGALSEPPFYGFPVHPSHAGTRGGVLTTPSAQVVRVDGTVIDGLYACGNTAANLLFGAGYGSGGAIGSSMVFGFLAAEHAAAAR
jgi:3-oxosteroid 1-dehydrogenase